MIGERSPILPGRYAFHELGQDGVPHAVGDAIGGLFD